MIRDVPWTREGPLHTFQKKSFGKGYKNAENVSFTQNDPNETFLSEFPTL